MNTTEIILHLRQQLLELRAENDRQATFELLSTCKMLTKISYEDDNKPLTALLVALTDASRELYKGQPLSKPLPTEEQVRAVMNGDPLPAPPLLPTAPTQLRRVEAAPKPQPAPPPDGETVRQQRLRKLAQRDWHDYRHIRDGSARQMRAYTLVFDELMLFHHLAAQQPIWVGCFPLGIDTEDSVIQVLCHPESLRPFLRQVKTLYEERHAFRLTWKAIDRIPTVLAHFQVGEFTVELFAQPRPIESQSAFINMLVEARLLALGGEPARGAVRQLKQAGASTEEAFTEAFDIQTQDPSATLGELFQLDTETLQRRVQLPGETPEAEAPAATPA